MKTWIVGLILLFSVAIHAQTLDAFKWTPPTNVEKGLFVVTNISLVLDMMQTLDLKNHSGYTESNPIMGQHPSDKVVIGYFIGVMGLHSVLWYNAPKPVRTIMEIGITALEVSMLQRNARIHCSFTF